MVQKIPHDASVASFASDGYGSQEPRSGDFPLRTKSVTFPQNTNLSIYSVVGRDANDKYVLATHGAQPKVAATGVLTAAGAIVADETVTIGATVYTFKASPSAANEVLLGATDADSLANLAAAINADPANTSAYGSGTAVHPDVTAVSTATTVTVTAKVAGTGGNSIASTETGTNLSWGGANLANGADGVGVVAEGILTVAVVTAAAEETTAAIYTSGEFNPNALVWDPSFNDLKAKEDAFKDGPSSQITVKDQPFEENFTS